MINKVYEFKLTSGDTIIAECLYFSENTYVVSDPMLVSKQGAGYFLTKYYVASLERLAVFDELNIVSMAGIGEPAIGIYYKTCRQIYGDRVEVVELEGDPEFEPDHTSSTVH